MVIPKHALNLSCSWYSLVLKKISHLRVFWACVFFFFVGPSYLSYAWRQDTLLFVYLLYNHCSLLHGITNRQWIEKGDGSLDRTARTPDNKGTLSQVNALFLNISVLHSQFRNENVLIILQNSYNYIKVEIKFASL